MKILWPVAGANFSPRYSKSEEHSDCTIICGPYHFKVHKLVIGAHSEYFRTALKANTFQVCPGQRAKCRAPSRVFANSEQEGKTGTIELKTTEADSDNPEDVSDDPEIVKLMVGYFYHLDYLKGTDMTLDGIATEELDGPVTKKKKKTTRQSAPAERTRASMLATSQVAQPSGPKVHLIEHAKVFAMAVKYHVDALKDLATQKFKVEVAEH